MNIAAIATAPGTGGIAVIRLSGPDAFTITDRIFRARNRNKTVSTAEAYTMLFGNIVDNISRDAACCVLTSEASQNSQLSTLNSSEANIITGAATTNSVDSVRSVREEKKSVGENIIDEVVISVFRAPHSFTGENTVEISCHGSIYIQQEILRLLIAAGARMAGPGEFTQRAFLNGRLDLSQAEAVADLINAQSAAAHTIALNQMRGNFSSKLEELRRQLLHFVSLLELELDFGDHDDLEFADRTELNTVAEAIRSQLSRLQQTFSQGNAIKNGIPVAIVGETNAGKSTLLNLLVGDNRAIVSDIHGTTRDVIEDTVNLRGITFRFIDTAGIRQTTDVVESIGIERTYQKMNQASIVLWMIDAESTTVPLFIEGQREMSVACDDGSFSSPKSFQEGVVFPFERRTTFLSEARSFSFSNSSLEGKKLLLLFNKSDQITPEQRESLLQTFADIDAPKLFISAKSRTGLEELETLLVTTAALPEVSQSDVIVTNLRHYEALVRALDSIHRVQDGLQTGLSGDFISQDLRECIHHLSDIVGEVSTDSVLQNIFKHFCIGK